MKFWNWGSGLRIQTWQFGNVPQDFFGFETFPKPGNDGGCIRMDGSQFWQPAFQVEVQGTTGAGDSAYAGFLAELLQGSGPVQTLKMACAVGACNVEDADSIRGISAREEILKRIDLGWHVSSEVLPS